MHALWNRETPSNLWPEDPGALPVRYTENGDLQTAERARYPPMSDRAAKPATLRTRVALLTGFGVVLGLMAFAGLDAIRVTQNLQNENLEVSQLFLTRNHALERIRSSVYLSGAVLREYLSAAESRRADRLVELQKFHTEMEDAVGAYARSIQPEESALVAKLRDEMQAYWKAVEPALAWDERERRERGEPFLDGEVYSLRLSMLQLADRISIASEQELVTGDRRAAELFNNFRWRLTTVLAVTLGLGLFVAGLSIAFIWRLETEARLRYQQIREAQDELKKLSARLVDAQEQERRSISRELHDAIGQSLSALLLDIGNLAAITPREDQNARSLLDTIKTLAETSVQAVRNMALLLRPSMLDDLGLVPALHWSAREVSRRTGLDVQVSAESVSDELPEEHKTCVYRVVQEALHNCAVHAGAHHVRISVSQQIGRLLLTVHDDGSGFDVRNTRGLGLLGMEERVEHLGGDFQIYSRAGQGTSLRVQLPLVEESQPAKVSE